MQKVAAVESASAEERERMRSTYRQRLKEMDSRLKVPPRLEQAGPLPPPCCSAALYSAPVNWATGRLGSTWVEHQNDRM